MGRVNARGQIQLLPREHGGLTDAMPSPSQSLLLHIDATTEDDSSLDFGVRITTLSGDALTPGAHMDVELGFWSDLARLHLVPGTRFELRYPTRVVGLGTVLEILPF